MWTAILVVIFKLLSFLIGVALGLAIGLGLFIYVIYRDCRKKRAHDGE